MLSLILFAKLQTPVEFEGVYKFKNMKVAYFVAKNPMEIAGTAFPDAIFVAQIRDRPSNFKFWLLPDSKLNAVRVFGAKSDVEAMMGYISQFDVKPKPLIIEATLTHEDFGMVSKFRIDTVNNHTVSIGDAEIGWTTRVTPRINDDGTVTVLFEGEDNFKATARAKLGQTMRLGINHSEHLRSQSGPTPAKQSLEVKVTPGAGS